MAEAARDHSDSKRTVDDLFQLLVHVHGKSPPLARREILKQLQDDGLSIELHIKGGVRSIGPVRPPTPEEQVEEKRTGIVAEARYSTTPPEGVTLPVDEQSWEGILLLRIRDKRLVIEPGRAFDYPWDAYSFTVVNWSLVEALWPNPNSARSDLSASASKPEDPPKESPKVAQQEWWDAYLTPETKSKLAAEYSGVTEASEAIAKLMAEDPTIKGGAYEPRYIEQLLRAAKVFPLRRR